MRTILVVEDEPRIAGLVRDYLEHAGFAVLAAGDGAGGLALARTRRPDAIVLDLGLPRIDGLDVIRSLRRDSGVPIVILTARGDETDRIIGLELGADDYVVKPFSPKELVARVRAVLRRADGPADGDERIVAGDLELDLARRRVTVGGRRGRPHAHGVRAAGHARPRARPGLDALAAARRGPRRSASRRTSGRSTATSGTSGGSSSRTGRAARYVRTVHGVGYALEEQGG